MGTVKQYDEEFNNRMFNYIHKNVKIKIKETLIKSFQKQKKVV